MTAARELAAELMMNSPHSLLTTKRLLVRVAQDELTADWNWASQESIAIRETDDLREGLAAFLEKRKPKWSER